ncbi:MAG: FCD domain-containing protein [Thermodesulfobacteriota bacterium]|nr:FCD domain-containing protein [Thermodesulfobacteriota bacterium]
MKEILDSIQSGALKPGDKLPTEHELTKMFGVGRSSLREAMSALALVGYIEVIQGRGTFVKKDLQSLDLSAFELRDIQAAASIIDIIEIREILECNTARLAARRADSNDIDRMQTILARMKKNADNIKRFSEHDFDFHVALAEASGNEMILQMMKFIVKKVHQEYVRLKHETLFEADEAIITAEKIVASVAGGEEENAAIYMEKHLHLVTAELKRMVSSKKSSSTVADRK